MKLKGNETIANEVGTHIGTLTWIDWEHNRGRVTLDPKPGADPAAEPVEVECAFRYAGQHWIWNMDAYPEEDIASHSAFAFCMGDRVMLLHPVPATAEDPERPKYVAVAILKEEDDGQGGKTVTLEKRRVWPLYRLGHEAFVLNFKYAGLGGKGAGFPFISNDGRRDLQNPYTDQRGHTRAFGTPERDGGTGNPRLVVTREEAYVPGYPPWYGKVPVFIPHATHEFAEPGEDIPYVPDALMQTTPNYRGRIIGWSAEDEILIDNIPVARVTGAEDIEAIVPSWKAVTRKFVYLDETNNTLTALFVTMDCNFDWRPRERSGNPNGAEAEFWYPPLYAFYVQSGLTELSSLCVHAAMETPREELPVIALREDAAASWKWQDLQRQEPNYILNNQADNFSGGVEIAFPGHEAEIFFWGGVIMTGTAEPGRRRKIGLRLKSADDGSVRVEKFIGDLELFSPFNEDNLEAYVEHADRVYTNSEGTEVTERYIAKDYARLKRPVSEEAARSGETALIVEVSGVDSYVVDENSYMATYDTDLRKRYLHRGPTGEFVIAEEMQTLTGGQDILHTEAETNTVRATMSMIVFTHIDLLHGVYGYWDVTWLDDVLCRDIAPHNTNGGNNTGKNVIWNHWVKSAKGAYMTHRSEGPVPYGSGNDDAVIINLAPLARLIRYSIRNNPGTPGYEPWLAHYCHNIWNLPRFRVDDMELTPDMRVIDIINDRQHRYKWYIHVPAYYSRAPENDIYSWLQGTTWLHGTKRKQEAQAKSPLYDFSLTPLTKEVGVWPYFKNVCLGFGGDFLVYSGSVDTNRNFAGILYTDAMKFEGAAYGDGDFSYTVSFDRQSNPYPQRCSSPGMEKLFTCTGRNDATISAD